VGRIVTLEEASAVVEASRARQRWVFTNGHFDLLHVGHLRYLRAARALGDQLVVGVNDDASTRRLKGPQRPIVPAAERAELLAALVAVDWVILFDADTAQDLVATLRPDVYVKGGDYATVPGGTGKSLPEAEVVRTYSGAVEIVPLLPARSSSALVERIIARYCRQDNDCP